MRPSRERLATWSRGCLTMQGYAGLGEDERRSLWLGLRFSPALCLTGIVKQARDEGAH